MTSPALSEVDGPMPWPEDDADKEVDRSERYGGLIQPQEAMFYEAMCEEPEYADPELVFAGVNTDLGTVPQPFLPAAHQLAWVIEMTKGFEDIARDLLFTWPKAWASWADMLQDEFAAYADEWESHDSPA